MSTVEHVRDFLVLGPKAEAGELRVDELALGAGGAAAGVGRVEVTSHPQCRDQVLQLLHRELQEQEQG